MDCLELNIRQQILSDLAACDPSHFADEQTGKDPLSSRVHILNGSESSTLGGGESGDQSEENSGTEDSQENERIYMTASRIQCNVAFGDMVKHSSPIYIAQNIETLFPTLLDVLNDIPRIDFDTSLSWRDWALPDQLVYSTISSLLQVCNQQPQCRGKAMDAICSFLSKTVEGIDQCSSFEVLVQIMPALHGFYRGVSSTPYKWDISQWRRVSQELKKLCFNDVVEKLNHLLVNILQNGDADAKTLQFVQTFVSRYISEGRPLSGYFIVCCVIETEWTILAQVLVPSLKTAVIDVEAAAANKAWVALLRDEITDVNQFSDEDRSAIRSIMAYAMQCFTDFFDQVQEMESEPSIDTYAWETMSESLKLASVCSVARGQIDDKLFSRISLLLSNQSPISDNLVQEAALKSTAILVRSFPEIASVMASQLRRFVTSPLPLFDYEFAPEGRAPPLAAAAKCLSLCIKLAPGDDLVMSNMYSLLNFIAATSKDTFDTSFQGPDLYDPSTLHSLETGLRGLSEDEKRLTGISTISVVTRLALEFNIEEVTKLTISMLLQRLRSAEPTVEAAIAYNLVDLALIAPEGSFVDIIRSFSAINRSANPEDPRFSNNMVLAAQTRLAQDLNRRPELFDIYLTELLTLFLDKGIAIQNLRIANAQVKVDNMIEQLASLLLPIDALLSHPDFKPYENASPEIVSLFRNSWFLCVLFNFTAADDKEVTAMDWLRPALTRIAAKTPPMVIEETHGVFASDIEYNTVIRQEYADSTLAKQRFRLTKFIMLRSSELRTLSTGQVIFLLAMHDIESLRALEGLPSSLVTYFINESLNRNVVLSACMEGVAKQVIRGCQIALTTKASQQALPKRLSGELRQLVISSTHRIAKAREIASEYLNQLLVSFPSLMCDPHLVYAMLEVLTLLQRGTDNEYVDEYEPTWEYRSERANITLHLTDNYQTRNEILSNLLRNANSWFELASSRAPLELQSTLQKYLAVNQSVTGTDSAELGASIAERFGKDIGPVHRHLFSLKSLSRWDMDQAKILTSQIAIRSYYSGEAAGFRFAGKYCTTAQRAAPHDTPQSELSVLREKLQSIMADIRSKRSSLTVQELRRLLYRCAAVLVSMDQCDYDLLHYVVALPFAVATPPAMVVGAEIWSWLLAEKSTFEVALMSEIVSSWSLTIKHEKGVFSQHIKLAYRDPLESPIAYAPTDKESIDKDLSSARRLLSPHVLVLHLLYSRLQAARYYQPTIMFLIQQLVLRSTRNHKRFSTHSLAREPRFSFLLFGFEALKSSHLDAYCESLLRESLYRLAFSWYSVRPQWTFGADRAQLNADLKVLSELLSHLQTDVVRGLPPISSLSPLQSASRTSYYATRLKDLNTPLRHLTESELFRLSVWANPINDPKRTTSDLIVATERTIMDTAWVNLIRSVWNIDPAIAISMAERFKYPLIRNEVARLVRSSPKSVLGVSEAVLFLLGDGFDPNVRRDLKYLLLWASVPPITAITFFEKRYNNQAQILQYAHRVLERHPVELTFFFIPQVVQALRYDTLGYVSQFIFETAKISQLFCHQIIWNMKANCYKDDLAETADPMKPKLDAVTENVVKSLSGEARGFYDREFNFFNEVTSISGKLKPYIKRTKPEKKAKIDEEMAKITVDVGVYLPSNPDGVVVDIDKKSGRPLQSHAKAPFMAIFKVRKERIEIESNPDSVVDGTGVERRTEYDVWQQAIFKVGDDCRQDVLALQTIAMFKNIFMSIGLPLYLFPYRVTATGPGCGVIDVVPNATSRDEMGRAKVNDLLDFFIAKYGGQDTVTFQKARLNFIQSMAAYSVACYILQIKDRHNGNIMIDGEGHIIHIDFGFLFDIDEYFAYIHGVKFEPNSFKLNHEMVILMGGRYSQGYQLFMNLTVKAFLAIRPFTDQIVDTVQLMLDTGLPSFKGESTIRRLRDRFALHLNERQAAEFMVGIIRNAHENVRSTAYDEFQRLQNGIPY